MDASISPVRLSGKLRLLLFSSGDFAFNLFWQSSMLFLLFYYTDVLGIPIGMATAIFTIGALWDGFASLGMGILLERRPSLGQPAMLRFGAPLLALAFVGLYLPPMAEGALGFAGLLAAHLLFRTAYAATNLPYLAMSARISRDSHERAFVAGTRMLFGTAAAVVVAIGTMPLGTRLAGTSGGAATFVGAALAFAIIGTVLLGAVGSASRTAEATAVPPATSIRSAFISLVRNRAFISLIAAMTAMTAGATLLNKSVLYFFKYALGDADGAQLALASMAVISAVAVPCWMLVARGVGLRRTWLVAAGAAALCLLFFAAAGTHGAGSTTFFLVAIQATLMGLNFVFWAMLPNTIEYGDRHTGVHVEGMLFGLAALLQRLGIGLGTALLGWTMGSAGYVANQAANAATIEALRWSVALTPLACLLLSAAAMLLNPLTLGVHRRIVRDLEERPVRSE